MLDGEVVDDPYNSIHPANGDQHRDDQDIARVAPADAERLLERSEGMKNTAAERPEA